MSKTVTASEDWLSYTLTELDGSKAAAQAARAETAMKVRVEQRFAKFVRNAGDEDELASRLDAVDEAVRATADQVGVEYGVDPLSLYTQARTTLIAAGEEMPSGQAYDYKRVDPDSKIGDSPAGARGQNFEYDRDVDDTLGQSKDHPRELQSVEQHVEDRRDLQDTDAGLESIKRKVETINPDDTIGDNKGKGGTFPRGDQASPITSKFYLLD